MKELNFLQRKIGAKGKAELEMKGHEGWQHFQKSFEACHTRKEDELSDIKDATGRIL